MSDSRLLHVERIGGVGGFGLPGARVRSHGVVRCAELEPSALSTLERLFSAQHRPAAAGLMRDGFCYRISRGAGATLETIEVAEHELPAAIRASVKDELL
jgi:hypothetical protein